MGSLPELGDRTRAATPRPRAKRTSSDPHRHRAQPQTAVSTICKKEWLWKKPPSIPRSRPQLKRKDSASSSVGAASVRRLISHQPPSIPPLIVRRFTLLCVSSGLCATALLPFTAFAGAEAGALPLSLMHFSAAISAPFSPWILQKLGNRFAVTLSHVLVGMLLAAHSVETPMVVLLGLYAGCGLALSPMSLALAVAATSLAHAAGDEGRRQVALRRALRALRAAQDLGLVGGALMLGGALLLWPEQEYSPPALHNTTDEYFLEDDYEEQWCGAAGCPATLVSADPTMSSIGRRMLVLVWAALALLAALGAALAPLGPTPPADARSAFRDVRVLLSAPMGLFIGLQQGFIYTSYVRWYGVCVGGWGCAVRALLGAGVLQALAAATVSMAAARGRRGALAAGGGAAHAALMLALLRWRASRSDMVLPAVAAAAWGACAALWDVLQSSIIVGGCGWRSVWSVTLCARHLGVAAASAARRGLCARPQLAVLGPALVVALIAHLMLELRARRGAESGRRRQS